MKHPDSSNHAAQILGQVMETTFVRLTIHATAHTAGDNPFV